MRRAAKVDACQASIVEALRDVGFTVQSLAMVGKGCPDLLVCHHLYGMHLLEVKNPERVKTGLGLTDDQKAWHEWWPRPVPVVKTVLEALEAVGVKV